MDLNPVDNYLHGSWEALGNGAPTLVALAQLCSDRWVKSDCLVSFEKIAESREALAILFAARDRGLIEIRGVNSAFDAAARLLAVYVELDNDRTIAFRDREKPQVTLRFLQAFRDLCEWGLVIHHIHRDFSLAPRALEIAQKIKPEEVQEMMDKATEFGLHD